MKTYIVPSKEASELKIRFNNEDLIIPGTTQTAVTNKDSQINRYTPSTIKKGFSVEVTGGTNTQEYEISNMANLEKIDNKYISTSTGPMITVSVKDDIVSRSFNFTPSVTTSSTVESWTDYISGSLGEHITGQVLSRAIAGKSIDRLSMYDPNASQYTHNPNFWLSDINLTCFPVHVGISPTYSSRRFLGCLITNRHLLMSKHALPPLRSNVHFLNPAGTTISAQIYAYQMMNDDVAIAELYNDVHTTITPCKIFRPPTNKYFYRYGLYIACNGSGQVIARMGNSNTSLTANKPVDVTKYPQLAGFTKDLVSGDSGAPLFAIINGEVALIGTHWTSRYTNILGSITELKVTHNPSIPIKSLIDINVSSFPTY